MARRVEQSDSSHFGDDDEIFVEVKGERKLYPMSGDRTLRCGLAPRGDAPTSVPYARG